ncbi:MAG: hypothetical protein IH874_03675 [Candidatus Dadabacteria bacterium]|nr:hypothetical protein [Candidatus Dadabacteria bacterium]
MMLTIFQTIAMHVLELLVQITEQTKQLAKMMYVVLELVVGMVRNVLLLQYAHHHVEYVNMQMSVLKQEQEHVQQQIAHLTQTQQDA